MRYAELRELEMLLDRFIATRPASSALLPPAERVRRGVIDAAGKAQGGEGRPCGWCGRTHNDRHPYLCDGCVNRKGVPLE